MSVSAIERYYSQVQAALSRVELEDGQSPWFNPGYKIPSLSNEMTEYLSAAQLGFAELGTVGGCRLTLLDLMGNPRTRTTKTFASLVIIARAIDYIRRTDERIMILTPSSANKATALRDAVARAYEAGLASPDQLRIACVVPQSSITKLWASSLSEEHALRPCNPICLYTGDDPAAVKVIAREVVQTTAEQLRAETGTNLWFTLDLKNYRPADAVRAFAEHELLPREKHISRWHAHAVSSAFGLLGHCLGTSLLEDSGPAPGYFLVQHLATPDMVLSLHRGDPARSGIPAYEFDRTQGIYRQDADRHFPATTFDTAENLEGTFYTRSPDTSTVINKLIRAQGGDGIVVSLHECLELYPRIRTMLADARIFLPVDPRDLREWSLVMVMTGVIKGIERGLVLTDEVVVHGSGSYAASDYTPVDKDLTHDVNDAADLRRVLLTAAR